MCGGVSPLYLPGRRSRPLFHGGDVSPFNFSGADWALIGPVDAPILNLEPGYRWLEAVQDAPFLSEAVTPRAVARGAGSPS